MPRRSRSTLLAAAMAVALLLLGVAASRRGPGTAPSRAEVPSPLGIVPAEDTRDSAATMPDARGREVFPEASCAAPPRPAETGSQPRCVVSFGRPLTALGVGRPGRLAITSLAHAATVGWTLPGMVSSLLFEPLPPESEARAIVVGEGERSAWLAVGHELWSYDTDSGRVRRRTEGPGGIIEDLAASGDGRRIALITADDGQAHLLDASGVELGKLATDSRALLVALDEAGLHAAVASENGDIHLFALRREGTPEPSNVVGLGSQPAAGLAFAGRRLLAAGSDGLLRAFDVATARESGSIALGSPLLRLAAEPRLRLVATAATDGRIRLHRLADLGVQSELAWHRARISSLAFAAGPTLLSGDNDGDLALWDLGEQSQE